MKILVIGKFPPIEGGVSAQTYWFCTALAQRGHQIEVITDAAEVEDEYRIWLRHDDLKRLNVSYEGGGQVRVRWTKPWDERAWRHVPAGNPRVTKLVSLALEAARAGAADVICSYYLEPYAFAASIVSAWTGIPFVLRHAGSDRFRLMRNPDMASAYREIFSRATVMQAVDADYMGLGVPEERMARSAGLAYVPPEFSPATAPMSIPATLAELRHIGWDGQINDADPDRGKPIVGMYGKAGPGKGIGAVLDAVAREPALRDVQLLLVSGGVGLPAVRDHIARLGLRERSWLLPFLPHWRVPAFIRACDLVCALEQDFWIAQHSPSLPREVMACGAPLLMSGELAAKTKGLPDLAGRHAFTCDPRDAGGLATALAGALRQIRDEPSADARDLQEVLAAERVAIADGYEHALSSARSQSAGRASRALRHTARVRSAAARRKWLAEQVPAVWKHASDDLAVPCDDPGTRLKAFLADVVTRVLAFAFGAASAHIPAPERSVGQLEAALLWMHTDCEGARGAPVFNYPDGSLPADIAADNKLMYSPAPGDLCPLASSLVLFMKPSRDAAEVLHGRMREVALARGGDPPRPAGHDGSDGWWLFAKSPSLEGAIYSVDAKIKQLIEACDGRTRREQIDRTILGPAAEQAWRSVAAKGLVEFVWYP
jgi:glycosyltransferase involved in cell wall biosynthesis